MWAWAAAQYRFGTVQENSVHPCLKDTGFFFFLIIQNFQTLYYHIKDTRCQHIVTRRKPGGSRHGKFQWAWASAGASSESCCLSVHPPPS